MNDYLWDKSGEPDAEIERLEKLLTPLAHSDQQQLILPRSRMWIGIAIAASLLVMAAASWRVISRNRPAWQVSGDARVTRLAQGQSLETSAGSHAKLEMESVGEVEIEPNSQVRVLALGDKEQRLDLRRGKISALIWAPPGQFVVNTPSAVTVDLGCAYTLEVDDSGATLVKVTAGWVAFEGQGQESFIPATAVCLTRPGKAPGIPYYEEAPAALKSAVDRGAIQEILAEARPRDAITVWHLLRRVPVEQRASVFDRLEQLIAVPGGVTREGVIAGNAVMIDALWDSLGLGDTDWWRSWKTKLR